MYLVISHFIWSNAHDPYFAWVEHTSFFPGWNMEQQLYSNVVFICFSVNYTSLSLDPTLMKIWDDRTPEKRWCQPPRRPQMMPNLGQHTELPNLTWSWIAIYNHCMLFTEHFCHMDINLTYVILDHKTGLKSLGYICNNSQKYIVWVKIIYFSFMPKIIFSTKSVHWVKIMFQEYILLISYRKCIQT